MDNKKILIVNLAKGILGDENMSFLGLLLVQKLLSSALSREDVAEEMRPDFFFYADEFQNFTTDEFATILSEARKYRLNLTLAHQYIGQLPENIKVQYLVMLVHCS
jgi:type IV secretory pathway TraG/TraD family ATPase VirD4